MTDMGMIYVKDAVPGLLSSLARSFDLVWATGWEHHANRELAGVLGLEGELPVLTFGGKARRGTAHWKIEEVERYAGSRAMAGSTTRSTSVTTLGQDSRRRLFWSEQTIASGYADLVASARRAAAWMRTLAQLRMRCGSPARCEHPDWSHGRRTEGDPSPSTLRPDTAAPHSGDRGAARSTRSPGRDHGQLTERVERPADEARTRPEEIGRCRPPEEGARDQQASARVANRAGERVQSITTMPRSWPASAAPSPPCRRSWPGVDRGPRTTERRPGRVGDVGGARTASRTA